MKKLSTAFLIVLTVALFVLSTSTNVIASTTVDLGDLDTVVDLNSADVSFTEDGALIWDRILEAFTINVARPSDGVIIFTTRDLWDDRHTINDGGYEGYHYFSLDIWVYLSPTLIDSDNDTINTNAGESGGDILTVTVTGVSVNDQYILILGGIAEDIPGTGYETEGWRVIVTIT